MSSYACPYCNSTAGPFAYDHIVPISRHGDNSPYNLLKVCQSCNSAKSAMLPSEWLPNLPEWILELERRSVKRCTEARDLIEKPRYTKMKQIAERDRKLQEFKPSRIIGSVLHAIALCMDSGLPFALPPIESRPLALNEEWLARMQADQVTYHAGNRVPSEGWTIDNLQRALDTYNALARTGYVGDTQKLAVTQADVDNANSLVFLENAPMPRDPATVLAMRSLDVTKWPGGKRLYTDSCGEDYILDPNAPTGIRDVADLTLVSFEDEQRRELEVLRQVFGDEKAKAQQRKTKRAQMVEIFGRQQTVRQWAQELGISTATVRWRLNNGGWSAEKPFRTDAKH